MKREARDFRERMPRPVRRIPLEEGSLRRRIIGAGIALVVAGLALFIALRTMTRVDAGWAWIEPDSAEGPTAEVRLWAELGAGEESPLTERKKLTALYSGAARELYTLFSPYEIYSGVNNLWWINHHPNEEVTVDPRLYSALEKCLFDMTPENILDEVTNSNLRGRGGGGFPTGRKWVSCARQKEEPKFIV